MANGPGTTGRGNTRWIWYLVGAIILILLLGWLLGWFSSDEVAEVETNEAAATEEAVEDAGEEAAGD
jgi:hypothetical protein